MYSMYMYIRTASAHARQTLLRPLAPPGSLDPPRIRMLKTQPGTWKAGAEERPNGQELRGPPVPPTGRALPTILSVLAARERRSPVVRCFRRESWAPRSANPLAPVLMQAPQIQPNPFLFLGRRRLRNQREAFSSVNLKRELGCCAACKTHLIKSFAKYSEVDLTHLHSWPYVAAHDAGLALGR